MVEEEVEETLKVEEEEVDGMSKVEGDEVEDEEDVKRRHSTKSVDRKHVAKITSYEEE